MAIFQPPNFRQNRLGGALLSQSLYIAQSLLLYRMVEKAASTLIDALIERGVKEILERSRRRKLTTQDLTMLLLYEIRARASSSEESMKLGFESTKEAIREGFDKMDSRFDEMNRRLDIIHERLQDTTIEIRGFREDMKPLWSALAKLVEAQAKT